MYSTILLVALPLCFVTNNICMKLSSDEESDEESSEHTSTDEESSGDSPTFEGYKEFLEWKKEWKTQKEKKPTQKKPLSTDKQQLQVQEAKAQIRINLEEAINLMSSSYSDKEIREMIERSLDALPFFKNDSSKRAKVKQVYKETLEDLLLKREQELIKTMPEKKIKKREEDEDDDIIEQLKTTSWDSQNMGNYFPLLAQCKNKKEVINMPFQGGYTILHNAASSSNLSFIKRLEELGADVDIQDIHSGRSALHIASSNGHIAVIRYLASKVTDINQQDNAGNTALHHALHPANKNPTESVRILLDAGIDPTITNNQGRTPLQTLNKIWRHKEYYKLLESASNEGTPHAGFAYSQKQRMKSYPPIRQVEYDPPSIQKKKGTKTAKLIASAVGELISKGMPLVNQLIQGAGGTPINPYISGGVQGFGHMLHDFSK